MRRIFIFPTIEEAKAFILTGTKAPVFVAGGSAAETAACIVRAVRAKRPEAFEAEAAGEPNGPDKADGTEVADETFEVNDAGAEEPDDADDTEPLPKVGSREGALLFALAEAFDIEASELRVIVGERGDGTSTEQERQLAGQQLAGQQLARTLQRLFGEQTPAEAPSPEA